MNNEVNEILELSLKSINNENILITPVWYKIKTTNIDKKTKYSTYIFQLIKPLEECTINKKSKILIVMNN